MAISSALVTTSSSAVFTCPASQEHAVTTLFFCNYSGTDVTLSAVHLVKSSSSATDTNKIISNLSIPAGETFTFDAEKIVLEAGDAIYVQASDNSRLNVTVSSLRVA